MDPDLGSVLNPDPTYEYFFIFYILLLILKKPYFYHEPDLMKNETYLNQFSCAPVQT